MSEMSPEKRIDIALVGLSCVDCVARARSSTTQWYVMNPVENVRLSAGGIGNALAAASGLGLKLGVSTRIGQDPYGDFLLERWREVDVDTRAVTVDPCRPTGFSFILDHGCERTPFFASGAIDAFCLDDIPESFCEASRTMLVFFAGALPSLDGDPLLELAKRCCKSETRVIVDASDSIRADYRALRAYMPYVNLVINTEEGCRITGMQSPVDVLKALDDMAGEDNVFRSVTRGDGAAFSIPRNGSREYVDVPSPFYGRPIKNVVGAGDAFRVGLAAYICLHYGEFLQGAMDYAEAGLFSSAVAYSYLNRTCDVRPFDLKEIEELLKAAK